MNLSKNLLLKLFYLIPLFTAVLLIMGYIWAWSETKKLDQQLIVSSNKNILKEIQIRLELLLYERAKDLAHLGSLTQKYGPKTGKERFISDATGIINREKMFYSIGSIDTAGKFQVRVPEDTNRFPIVLRKIPFRNYLRLFSSSHISIMISPPIEKDTLKLFILLDATYNFDSSRVTGAVTGIIYVNQFIDRIISSSFPEEYHLKIFLDKNLLFDNKTFSHVEQFVTKNSSQISFSYFERTWAIQVTPPPKTSFSYLLLQNDLRLLFNILFSLVVAALLGIATYLMLQARYIQSKLMLSENRYRLITENVKDLIFLIRLPSGHFEFISPTCINITGHSQEEFYSNPLLIKQMLLSKFIPLYEEKLANLQKGIEQPEFSFQIKHTNGNIYWLTQKSTIIFNEKGTPQAIEGLITDSTVQKKIELEREQLIKELEEKNFDLERFIYIISHELKTPLITIQGFLGYLEEEAMKGDVLQLHQDITMIISAAETMQKLLNDLVELNRIGKNTTSQEEIDTNDLVRNIIQQFQSLIDKNKITMSISSLPNIKGYKNEISELFQNLIENAIKFTQNQPQPKIEIGITTRNNDQVFFIRDNGIGINLKYKNRIFGLFNKLDPHSEGTGAGLAIAKRVIANHNGWIDIESAGLNQGSTFLFKLPLI